MFYLYSAVNLISLAGAAGPNPPSASTPDCSEAVDLGIASYFVYFIFINTFSHPFAFKFWAFY